MSKIKALINPVTPFAQNAPIIYCENTKQCAFVDPGGDIETYLTKCKMAHSKRVFSLDPEHKFVLTKKIFWSFFGRNFEEMSD